jgi:hypothetical protein
MPTAAARREESQTDTAKYLAAHLEMADPDLGKAAEPALKEWEAVDAKAGRRTTAFDRAQVLACMHHSRCKARRNPAARCDACAISDAILLCCMISDEQPAHDLVDTVDSLMRGLAALEEEVTAPLQRFDAIAKMRREPHPLPGDLRRRSLVLRIKLVFSVARRLLRDVPEILDPEAIYDGLQASPERKPGPKPDRVRSFLADYLKHRTGWGARRVARTMGLERDNIRRRRQGRERGSNHELN